MVGMEASLSSIMDTSTASERAKTIQSKWLNDLCKSAVYTGLVHKDTQSNSTKIVHG